MSNRRPAQQEEVDAVKVRPARPADRAEVDRLIDVGVLPGYVDCEFCDDARIRHALESGRGRFLVAELDARIIGTVAVAEASPDVGHLHWLRVDPRWQADLKVARRLARAAAAHAREAGFLKLVLHAPRDVEARVASYYHQLGFELSRAREITGIHVLEFYLNLYERPAIEAGQ